MTNNPYIDELNWDVFFVYIHIADVYKNEPIIVYDTKVTILVVTFIIII